MASAILAASNESAVASIPANPDVSIFPMTASPIVLNATPARAPIAAVLTALPVAVESFSPFNNPVAERNKKPTAAPPTPPVANAAAAVSIATAKLALPGFAFAQSLITLIH